MFTTRRSAVFFFFLNVVVFYWWLYILKDNDWLRAIGAAILPIAGGTLSFVWLYSAFRNIANKQKYFWLLLSIGVFFFTISNIIWLFFLLSTGKVFYPDGASYTWLLAYFFFLVALIYKTQIISIYGPNNKYSYNIIVLVTIAVSICVHYLIKPVMSLSGEAFSASVTNLAYPIMDLTILFVTILLYYLSQYSQARNLILAVVFGFSLLILADTLFISQTIMNTFELASFIDPIWYAAILIFGLAGINATKTLEETKWKFNKFIETKESIFIYVFVFCLLLLTLNSYEWKFNALSIGMLLIFLLIVVRQLIIMKKNETLVREYRYLAYHDPLTRLKNRTCFKEDLQDIMENASRNKSKVALLLIDLDRFKTINDTFGHHIGDDLLIDSSYRLKQSLQNYEGIYRIGGDEFIIILPDISPSESSVVANHLLEEFSEPFLVRNLEIAITPSIGISIYPDNGLDSEGLLKNADAAMYLAKEKGKNNFQFYDSALNEQLTRKVSIENGLRKAIENNELSLYYQPKVDLESRQIIGLEALLRWEHAELGEVSPVEFIPILEENGEIISIGEWVLYEACKQNKAWQDKGFAPLVLSVNVSVRQFQQGDFVLSVRDILQETGLAPEFLELEITESIMQNIKESKEVLKGLRALGVKTSIDDFGTGYSSLFILKELPIDTIKIDKSFIDDICEPTNQSMIKAIVDIGLNLNLMVVAEGIENEQQVKTLLEYECVYGQGYLFSKPAPVYEIERQLFQAEITN